MTDCSRDDIRDLLPDLVHDQLDAAERARVQQHLADCADCVAELELLRSMRATAFATPEVNVDRIAAAVRASLAESGADGVRDDGVVPIGEAHRRLGGGASSAGVRRAPHRVKQRTVGVGIPQSWRIAAAIVLVAAGAGGYALTRGSSESLRQPTGQSTVAASEPSAPSAERAMAPERAEAKTATPAATPAAPMLAANAAGAAESDADTAAPVPGPLILGDALNELSESDMQALLQSVDDLEAMPDLEPHQLPLLASVVEGAL